ncbi:MAG: hypothetical protein A4E65_02220 [Syntrophorhabdus sp. PtaU1.Bin153]|nr:MAG: hypothetical protein A4E65_02220 [Syntrophorhabdus sp. PtaU1.Bin153]
MPIAFLLFLGKTTGPMIAKAIGQSLYDQFFPLIDRARKKAVTSTAKALQLQFPSGNFVEENFRFDSPAAKAELQKLAASRGSPDEEILNDLIIEGLRTNWPDYSSKASLIVETFLQFFKEECLAEPRLMGRTLASIMREEHAATQRLITVSKEEIIQRIDEQNSRLSSEIKHLVEIASSTLQEEFAEPPSE